MLDEIAKKLPALTAVLLVGSITYDYMYLLALGLGFADVPTSIADHVRSALLWASGIATFSVLGFIGGLASPPIADGEPTPIKHPRRAVDIFFLVGVVPKTLIVSVVQEWPYVPLTLGVVASAGLVRFRPGASHIDSRLGSGSAGFVYGLPALLCLLALLGWIHGRAPLYSSEPRVVVTLKLDYGVQSELKAVSIRRFSTSAVIIRPKGIIDVLPGDSILRTTHQYSTGQLLGCFVRDQWCLPAR